MFRNSSTHRLSWGLVPVVASALLFACGGVDHTPSTAGGAKGDDPVSSDDYVSVSNQIVITESDDGKTFEVKEGTDIVVKLSSNPSTGYDWSVTNTNRTFGHPASTEYVADAGPMLAGSGGTTVMTWETKGMLSMVGTHSVTLEERRSWDPPSSPSNTSFTFTVTITPTCYWDVVCEDGACVHGFKLDANGCQTCECSEPCTDNGDCGSGRFCKLADGQCLLQTTVIQQGECTDLPSLPPMCPEMLAPVCGCDGETYGNSCDATGVSIAHDGRCLGDTCDVSLDYCAAGHYCAPDSEGATHGTCKDYEAAPEAP